MSLAQISIKSIKKQKQKPFWPHLHHNGRLAGWQVQVQVQPSVRRSSKIQAAEPTMAVEWHFRPTNFQWQLRYFLKNPALFKSKASHRLPPRFSNVPSDLKTPKHNRKNSKTKKKRREERAFRLEDLRDFTSSS